MTMPDLCASLSDDLPKMFDIKARSRGDIRVRTPMQYPDGGFVDVFVDGAGGFVTDYGDALGWLRTNSRSGKLTVRQREMLADISSTLGVPLLQGQLKLGGDSAAHLADAVQRVAQAAVRVADISLTFRTRSGETVSEELDAWLRRRSFHFERSVRRRGRSGTEWLIDYRIHADGPETLIFLLSSGARAAARRRLDHVVSGCMDLSLWPPSETQSSLISLIDDAFDVWRDEDLTLLSEVSRPVMWSNPAELELLLRSA